MSLELQAECNNDCLLWYLFHLPWKTQKAIRYLYQMVTVLSIGLFMIILILLSSYVVSGIFSNLFPGVCLHEAI
ncbi:Type IV secretory pathway [Xylella fastidiosa]|nr:Type IV secretory pathway [Xylella fastidiosa]